MTSVAALIQAVHEAGGQLHPMGDRLKVLSPHPLDEGLISELRAHRPAVLAFLGSQRPAPAEWAAGVAKLIGMDPPGGYTRERWRVLVKDAGRFLDTWAAQAAALRWSAHEVFGCHCRAPATRYDAMGLVSTLNGGRIAAMTEDHAVVENLSGARLRHYRRLTAPEGEWALLWNLLP